MRELRDAEAERLRAEVERLRRERDEVVEDCRAERELRVEALFELAREKRRHERLKVSAAEWCAELAEARALLEESPEDGNCYCDEATDAGLDDVCWPCRVAAFLRGAEEPNTEIDSDLVIGRALRLHRIALDVVAAAVERTPPHPMDDPKVPHFDCRLCGATWDEGYPAVHHDGCPVPAFEDAVGGGP